MQTFEHWIFLDMRRNDFNQKHLKAVLKTKLIKQFTHDIDETVLIFKKKYKFSLYIYMVIFLIYRCLNKIKIIFLLARIFVGS